MTVTLRALGWDHPRCMDPMRACADRWAEITPGFRVDWGARSLRSFGDQPIRELALGYDLVMIDHPSCGEAEHDGCLRPLEEVIDEPTLAELEAGAVGPSHGSYRLHGHQWALATDAACVVTAYRPDLLERAPNTWPDVLDMAARRGSVALPLAAPHAISSWMTLVANHGGEPYRSWDAGVRATEILLELTRLGPRAALDWEPPDALSQLTSGDRLALVPLTYGYGLYASRDVRRPCRFTNIPSAGNDCAGAVLGGAGLAVTAFSVHPRAAGAFAAWVSGAEAQHDIVARANGQPSHRAAWDDPELDQLAGGLYSGTRATIEAAWVRPRDRWYPGLQLEAGELLRSGLRIGRDARTLTEELHGLYRMRSPERSG
jgi:multiple sugar transport system substrate-binding protein